MLFLTIQTFSTKDCVDAQENESWMLFFTQELSTKNAIQIGSDRVKNLVRTQVGPHYIPELNTGYARQLHMYLQYLLLLKSDNVGIV